jgi:hypothetical protein
MIQHIQRLNKIIRDFFGVSKHQRSFNNIKTINMIIEYLRGPNQGKTENIVGETEEKGTPIYITESGKELSSLELNKTFRIKPTKNDDINFAELGDPSLIEMEKDYITDRLKNVNARSDKPKQTEQPTQTYQQSHQETQKVSNTVIDTKPQNPFLDQLFGNAKKNNSTITVTFDINAPTKDFYSLIMNAINFSDDEFVDKVFSEIDMNIVNSSIKDVIKKMYVELKEETPKKINTKKVIKPKPTGS